MPTPEDPTPPTGLIASKYRLTRLLGRGGMGTVWEGTHESLGTRVAVKFIDTEHAASDEVRQRFVNEARAAARLRSKHVVQIYDQGVGDDGRPYIVMEFLSGEPLDQRLDRVGRLRPRETALIVLHVARALSKAHEAGIVHRDLKPENVILVHDDEDQTDVAKVVDFGIAKFTEAGPATTSSTRTGAVLGTPQYMSPEQARGLRSVDGRTDLWALGVIVYRCLTGTHPFRGEAIGDLLVNICTAEVPPPSTVSEVPAGLDEWMRRALAREPSERFQTAAELSDPLAALCGLDARIGSGPVSADVISAARERVSPGAVTASPYETVKEPSPARSGVPLWLLAALFFLVTALVVFVGRTRFRSSPEPEPDAEAHRAAAQLPGPSAATAASAVPAAPDISPAITIASAAPSTAPPEMPKGEEHAAHPPTVAISAKPSVKPKRKVPVASHAAEPPATKPEKRTDLLGY